MAKLPEPMSGGDFRRVFVVDSSGVTRLGPANDSAPRQNQREQVAASTSTPDGLASFVESHGLEEASLLLHDAMFGRLARSETPAGTPAGDVAREWK